MKNKFLLLSIATISAMSIFSCKDEEEAKTSTPSVVGTWEMSKLNVKLYVGGMKFVDTTVMQDAGASSIAVIKEDKTIMQIEKDVTGSDTIFGTYSITGTKFILNLVDPKDGPYTEEYENLSYNATELTFTMYDPNKTDLNRTEITPTFKRK
jgi:hypothetical protein